MFKQQHLAAIGHSKLTINCHSPQSYLKGESSLSMYRTSNRLISVTGHCLGVVAVVLDSQLGKDFEEQLSGAL